jgi:cell division transport system permease protein
MNLAATVTMVLMLVLLSTLVIIISGVEAGLTFIESKVEVRAELLPGLASIDIVQDLQVRLEALPEVATTRYITKAEALIEFREARAAAGQDDLTVSLGVNPLPDQIAIELKNPRESRAIIQLLEDQTAIVARVVGQQSGIDRLVNLTALLRTIGVGLIAFVGLTVLLIVINSIRMALMSRAQEIEIMRLVGASDRYVRWPFILEGILIGLASAVVTLLLLLAVSRPISDMGREIAGEVPLGFDGSLTVLITSVVMLAGLGLGGVGAWISVRAYLRN